MPYTKPNNISLYIHIQSYHPPIITKNLPISINKRLSEISPNASSFIQTDYINIPKTPLTTVGITTSSHTNTHIHQHHQTKKTRRRNITWYNPPYSRNVTTNIRQSFLKILDEEFPPEHNIHQIFNRNKVKISCCCMSNMKGTFNGHNMSILNKRNDDKVTKN